MLILTRRPEESIRIGEEITITLLGIRGNQVRIGIDAPRGIAVHRREIYDRIQAERNGGASVEPAQLRAMPLVSPAGDARELRSEAREATEEL